MSPKQFQIVLDDNLKEAVDFTISERDRISAHPGDYHPSWIPYNSYPKEWHLVLSPDELRSLLTDLWLFGTKHKYNHYALYEIARQISYQ